MRLSNDSQPEQPPPNRSILPSTSTNTYDLTKIIGKKKSKTTVTILELHSEIKTLKSELQTLKQAQQKDSAILQHLLSKIESQSNIESDTEDQTIESHALPHTLTNIEHIPDDFLNVLTQISSKKYLIRIHHSDHTEPAYSTCIIHKVIHPKDWGQPLHQALSFPMHYRTSPQDFNTTYTYWDYQHAWFNAFLIQNQNHSHSWLFYFHSTMNTTNLPLWFL